MRLCVCPSIKLSKFVAVCVCLSAYVHDSLKNNGSINLKLEHIVVYVHENSPDEFDIGHCLLKVEVPMKFFIHLPQCKL